MSWFSRVTTASAVAVAISSLLGFTTPTFAGDDPLDKARTLVGDRKPREALAVLATMKGQEGDPGYLALRGETLMDLGRYAEAKADLEKAQKDAAEAAYAKIRLAHIEFLYGRDEKAAALLKGVEAPKGWERFTKSLEVLLDGPFVAKWGDAARACRARSKDGHYLVYSDLGMDEQVAAKVRAAKARSAPTLESVNTVGRLMDLIYKAYGKVFQGPKDEQLVHRVYVFSSREDFLAFSKSLGFDMEHALGFFDHETRILAADASARHGDDTLISDCAVNTLFHEGMHQFVHYFAPDMPSWFNEGLAEYFGPSQLVSKSELAIGVVENRRAKPGEPMTRLDTIRAALSGEIDTAPLSLKKFLTMESKGFAEGHRGHVNYAQAWSFVHYLMSSEKGKKLVRTYFKVLKDGKGEKAAFAETFAKEDLDEMEREWKAYVKKL